MHSESVRYKALSMEKQVVGMEAKLLLSGDQGKFKIESQLQNTLALKRKVHITIFHAQ